MAFQTPNTLTYCIITASYMQQFSKLTSCPCSLINVAALKFSCTSVTMSGTGITQELLQQNKNRCLPSSTRQTVFRLGILFMNICCDSLERSALHKATTSTGQHKHRKKKRRHVHGSSGIPTHDPKVRAREDSTHRKLYSNCDRSKLMFCLWRIHFNFNGRKRWKQLLKCNVSTSAWMGPRKFKVTSVRFNITE